MERSRGRRANGGMPAPPHRGRCGGRHLRGRGAPAGSGGLGGLGVPAVPGRLRHPRPHHHGHRRREEACRKDRGEPPSSHQPRHALPEGGGRPPGPVRSGPAQGSAETEWAARFRAVDAHRVGRGPCHDGRPSAGPPRPRGGAHPRGHRGQRARPHARPPRALPGGVWIAQLREHGARVRDLAPAHAPHPGARRTHCLRPGTRELRAHLRGGPPGGRQLASAPGARGRQSPAGDAGAAGPHRSRGPTPLGLGGQGGRVGPHPPRHGWGPGPRHRPRDRERRAL